MKPIVSDPFTAAKKAKIESQQIEEAEEEYKNEIKIDKEILAETQAIDIENATAKKVVQPKINNHFISNGTKKTKQAKSKDKDDDDEEDEDGENTKIKEIPKYDSAEFKKPSNGKDYNLKMVTFNVNGIRAAIEVNKYFFSKKKFSSIFFWLKAWFNGIFESRRC